MENETWLPVPGFPDYEVSSHGRLRKYFNGHHENGPIKFVSLAAGRGRYWHPKMGEVVLTAFKGPRPRGFGVHHWNGDASDDRLENLTYLPKKECI